MEQVVYQLEMVKPPISGSVPFSSGLKSVFQAVFQSIIS